jgi:hypothetical protein
VGGEGCTPGFWKNHTDTVKYPNAWPPTGYSPNQLIEAVFAIDVNGNGIVDGPTLIEGLNAGGGGLNALYRHAVAALLNSAHPGIDYSFSTAQVIAMFQAAIVSGNYEATKNLFAAENEQGCPISGK